MKNSRIFFVVVLLISASVITFAQQYDADSDFIVSNSPDGKAIVINGYAGSKQIINIPPQINKLPVTHIWENAFQNKNLTGVTIPDSVIYIGPRAFMGNKLTNIVIPDSVTIICHRAFLNNQLTSVTIGSGVTRIENNAFENNQLTTVDIPNSVTQVFELAFANNKITSVSLPDSGSYIRNEVFIKNPLTKIKIGKTIRLDARTFENDFTGLYNTTGREAGIYILNNNEWKKE